MDIPNPVFASLASMAAQPDASDIVSALPVAMLIVAPDNRIANANARAEALLNMARSAIIGSNIARTVRVSDLDAREDLLLTDKPLTGYDIRAHVGRNAEMEVDVMIAPVADHDGWRIIAIHPHSQAQKIAHRRIAGGNRSAVGAAAILAHEIKNPLSGIRGAAQLLDTGEAGSSALSQLICNEVDRIAALIDRMQDFTRDQPLTSKAENIYPLIDQAAEVAAAGFARHIRIVKAYDPSLPPVQLNSDGFVQVILNLLKNAAEALEKTDKPEIRITTAFRHGLSVLSEGGRQNASLPIEVLIADNGPGVPEHIREHLFNPFITGKRDGQGLGLALVDKLMRDMNGLVQYERVTGGSGVDHSLFRLLLPVGKS